MILVEMKALLNVGTSSDTAEFAVNSIWQWWRHFVGSIIVMPKKC